MSDFSIILKFKKPIYHKLVILANSRDEIYSLRISILMVITDLYADLYHESKKAHEYCFYKDNTLKTKVSYSLENKNKKRYFFRSKRPEDFPATVLNPEKVFNGHVVASNFKGSNIRIDNIVPFYPQSGREMPCHLDQRRMN